MTHHAELTAEQKLTNRIIVAASFVIIFAFSSVDHAISPLAEIFSNFFSVPLGNSLWLISYCTLGIVVGLIAGPAMLKASDCGRLVKGSVVVLGAALALFLLCPYFYGSLFLRFVFGLGAGVLSTAMWWLTYEGVAKPYYEAMVTVLMASRPMAVALGVPLAGYMSAWWSWRAAFFVFPVGGGA